VFAAFRRSARKPCPRAFLPLLATVLLVPVLQGATCTMFGESWPGGIGAILGHSSDEHRLFVREVPADSPAAEAGLQPGDEVLQIDGRDVAEMELSEVVAALHGQVDTKVKLHVRRGEETLDFEVTRAPYREP
jgi:C-terminal processing protease CtpA/Prc